MLLTDVVGISELQLVINFGSTRLMIMQNIIRELLYYSYGLTIDTSVYGLTTVMSTTGTVSCYRMRFYNGFDDVIVHLTSELDDTHSRQL